MKVALVSGTSIIHSPLFSTWRERSVETKFGAVTLREHGDVVVLNRHGPGSAPLPPHRINHRANLAALADLGFRDVVSFNSVGSLRAQLAPGVFVSCSDYVDLQQGPATYFDDELSGSAPGIANNLLPRLVAGLAPGFAVATGQTYVQTRGPRFETKAEIRVIRHWGDVVGMTLAHEADLCTELGLRYNSLGMVDNYANGLEGTAIDFATFKQNVHGNQERVNRFIARVLEILS
ncbi:MAG: MTAP family purine nucleoside phosphorylase [Burkholderiales bacterium]|nr:MTAP family purine nucleoside phosphorylase [Opitutaceae bacterium]